MVNKNRRKEARLAIDHPEKIKLIYRRTRRPIQFTATDISAGGLGGQGSQEITVGSEVLAILGGLEIELLCVWSKCVIDAKTYFSAGLVLIDGRMPDLIKVCDLPT